MRGTLVTLSTNPDERAVLDELGRYYLVVVASVDYRCVVTCSSREKLHTPLSKLPRVERNRLQVWTRTSAQDSLQLALSIPVLKLSNKLKLAAALKNSVDNQTKWP